MRQAMVIVLMVYAAFLHPTAAADSAWRALFDKELSQFETWIGVPHSSVKALPKGTHQSDDIKSGHPMGLNNDPLNVFSVIEEEGDLVVKVTGEIFGGINTRESFANYQLTMKFRWGFDRWPPRIKSKRDSGLLYHCYGEHGAFWNTWKSCMEYQIQESDIGDFIGLAGPKARYYGYVVKKDAKPDKRDQGRAYYDPTQDNIITGSGYTNALLENDAPFGNWNSVELYVVGDEAVHIVNGDIVFFAQDIKDGHGKKLTSGQIQLQSEAAEIHFKDLKIRSIKAFPLHIEETLRRIKPKNVSK